MCLFVLLTKKLSSGTIEHMRLHGSPNRDGEAKASRLWEGIMKRLQLHLVIIGMLVALAMGSMVASATGTFLPICPTQANTLTAATTYTVVIVYNASFSFEVVDDATGLVVFSRARTYTNSPNLTWGSWDWTVAPAGMYHIRTHAADGSANTDEVSFRTIAQPSSPGNLPRVKSWVTSGLLQTGQSVTFTVGFTQGASITATLGGAVITPTSSGSGTATFAHTFGTAGNYVFVPTVTDVNGSTNVDVTIPITDPTTPPATRPHLDNVTMSVVAVGQPTTIKVDYTALPSPAVAGLLDGVVIFPTISGNGTVTYSFTPTVQGNHTLTVTVTDANGSSIPENFNIVVPAPTTPSAPLPVIYSWTTSEAVTGQPIIVRANWTGAAGAGFIGSFDGTVIPPTSISAGIATFSVATSVEGMHAFTGVVTDVNGSANSATVFNVAMPGGTPPVTVVTGVTNISMSEFIRVDQEFTLMFNFAPADVSVTVVMVDALGGRTYMTQKSLDGGVASFTGIFRVAGASKLIITVDGLAPFTILINVEHAWMIMFKSDPTGMLFSVHPDEIISSNPRRSPYVGVKMERVDVPPPVGPLPVKSSFSNEWIRGTVKQGLHKTVGAFTLKAYPDR